LGYSAATEDSDSGFFLFYKEEKGKNTGLKGIHSADQELVSQ
jgi:hypothetical protein